MTSRPSHRVTSCEPTDTTIPEDDVPPSSARTGPAEGSLTLSVLWCPEEPWRIGEIALLPGRGPSIFVLGRGVAQQSDPGPRLVLARATPSGVQTGLPIGISHLSRVQAVIRTVDGGDELVIENVGRAPLWLNGDEVDRAQVRAGDTVQLGRQLLLLGVRRAAELARPMDEYPPHEFGRPDAFGIVGESVLIWRLRRQIAFLAARHEHVLVRGPSGSGKELVARAIHALSRSRDRPMVCRNAATIPPGLVDAELYGNAKSYPNAGMPERPGLIGEANGGTLYLDEFGELPEASQAHLLRVLDGGDYQRLGEAFSRKSKFRLIAATNRPEAAIKEDLLARLPLRLDAPALSEHSEDVPLILLHLLRGFAESDAAIATRFFPDPEQLPRVSLALVRALVQRAYRTNVRELEALLWAGIQASDDETIQLVPSGADAKAIDRSSSAPASGAASPRLGEPSPAQIREALDRHNGEIEATWRALGLRNRYVLRRLLAKHRIEIRRRV